MATTRRAATAREAHNEMGRRTGNFRQQVRVPVGKRSLGSDRLEKMGSHLRGDRQMMIADREDPGMWRNKLAQRGQLRVASRFGRWGRRRRYFCVWGSGVHLPSGFPCLSGSNLTIGYGSIQYSVFTRRALADDARQSLELRSTPLVWSAFREF